MEIWTMKNLKSAKLMSFASLFLMFLSWYVPKAQSQASLIRVEETKWQARISWQNTEEISTNDFAEYVFGKQQTVKYKYISVAEISVIRLAPKPRKYLDDVPEYERKKEWSTDIRNTGGNGTYQQKGTVIHLEFSDHTIDASVKSDSMQGFITIKSTGERGLWDAERVLNPKSEQPPSKKGGISDADIEWLRVEADRMKKEGSGYSDADLKLLSDKLRTECLPARGVLRVKMKDGSIIRIDLSQADEVMLVQR